MREHLRAGGRIELSIATAAVIAVDSETDRPPDLARKASRLLVEAAALHAVPTPSRSRICRALGHGPRLREGMRLPGDLGYYAARVRLPLQSPDVCD